MPSPSVNIRFAGEELVLDAAGALYWPDQRVLVVSDLHFEKSTFLARHGSFIAPYDTLDTLDRLDRLIAQYTPRELILLGDSFHDRHAWARLDDSLRARIDSINRRLEICSWIEGNHDIALIDADVPLTAGRPIGRLLFSHEKTVSEAPQVIGHYHPKVTVVVRGRGIRGSCFVCAGNLLVMPAFGSYTGGLDINHEAFSALIPAEPLSLYFLHRESIIALPTLTRR